MEHYVALYVKNSLFEGVAEADLLPLLHCLQAEKRTYSRGEHIFAEGEPSHMLGIVLSGRVNTVYEDVLGGFSIIDTMKPGQLFCDAFSCSTEQRMPVSVVAQQDTAVLLIEIERVLHTCPHCCGRHERLAENLIHTLADKYMALNRKMIHLSGRSTRRKLISYLAEQQRLAGEKPFMLPFSQQELADYLFVDRSGLSVAWNTLRRQGIVEPRQTLWFLNREACARLYGVHGPTP